MSACAWSEACVPGTPADLRLLLSVSLDDANDEKVCK